MPLGRKSLPRQRARRRAAARHGDGTRPPGALLPSHPPIPVRRPSVVRVAPTLGRRSRFFRASRRAPGLSGRAAACVSDLPSAGRCSWRSTFPRPPRVHRCGTTRCRSPLRTGASASRFVAWRRCRPQGDRLQCRPARQLQWSASMAVWGTLRTCETRRFLRTLKTGKSTTTGTRAIRHHGENAGAEPSADMGRPGDGSTA